MALHPPGRHGVTRRGFLLGAAAGVGAAVPLTWMAAHAKRLTSTPLPLGSASPPLPHPGTPTYPGRVIEVRHRHAVSADNRIDGRVVDQMVDRGMAELIGADDPRDIKGIWGRFFEKGDVVGIKVNPVGRRSGGSYPGAVGSISSPELVVKIVRCLRQVGIPDQDIVVFDRYADEFCAAGYQKLVENELGGKVRWLAASAYYTNEQLDITGFDHGRDRVSAEVARHVVGYDPDVFTVMGFCAPHHSRRDDRRFRSHLTLIVSRFINKMITLPVLKDHRSAGVTLALKNMSHGMNNNVARSHLSGIAHGFGPAPRLSGPNQCNTFIPQAVAQDRLRQKATLHILDGLIGVYEGGPGMWNKTWATWRHQGLFFATDPVALDHVGWDIIDARRAQEGWAPVEQMGWLPQTPTVQLASTLTPLAASHPLGAATLTMGTKNILEGRASDAFNLRQPDHIVLAGQLGLGVFDRELIRYQRVDLA